MKSGHALADKRRPIPYTRQRADANRSASFDLSHVDGARFFRRSVQCWPAEPSRWVLPSSARSRSHRLGAVGVFAPRQTGVELLGQAVVER